MAGETSAELTIVVRAQDAATRVIDGIGKTIGKVLLSPLKFVANAVAGIYKQFFSLKTLLVGGGIIAAVNGLTQSLAKAAVKYEPLFSDETQKKIDDTASAFNKLGASLKQTFATIITDFDIAGKLNQLSDWLRDNQAKIVQGFREVAASVVSAAEKITQLFNAFETGWAKFRASAGPGFGGAPPPAGPGNPFVSEGRLRTAFGLPTDPMLDLPIDIGGSGPIGIPQGRPTSRPSGLGGVDPLYAATVLPELQRRIAEVNTEHKKTAEIVRVVSTESDKAADSTVELADAYHVVAQEAKAAIIAFEEVADTIAGNVTDGLFAFIEGTQSAGRAFASMVSNILRELGRLLVYRSLLKGILSLAGGGGGAISDSSAGGAFTSESGFGGATGVNFASGGTMRRGGFATVGENGPERVFLPAGSHVMSSQRSRDGGGDTINVYGARDPKATAREVAYERRRSAGLRRALA